PRRRVSARPTVPGAAPPPRRAEAATRIALGPDRAGILGKSLPTFPDPSRGEALAAPFSRTRLRRSGAQPASRRVLGGWGWWELARFDLVRCFFAPRSHERHQLDAVLEG